MVGTLSLRALCRATPCGVKPSFPSASRFHRVYVTTRRLCIWLRSSTCSLFRRAADARMQFTCLSTIAC